MLVYNLDEIDNLSLNDLVYQVNDQLFLEVLLMEIRGKTSLIQLISKKKTINVKNS